MSSKIVYRLFFAFSCIGLPSYSQIVINEYSCSNLSSFQDNFGRYEDWVELYNTTASPVNLNGYYMSNAISNPTQWKFGNVTINPNGFLRIWASGRNINTGADIHTGFTLIQCKPQDIVLSNAAGTIIDSYTLKPTQAGHSRGRTTNGGSAWGLFLTPTPGSSNTNPFQEYASRPVMNVAAGFYTSTQHVSVTSPDPNVKIYYTTDGTTPTASSTIYSSPVVVSSTKVLRAIAFSSTPSIPPSFVESNTYFINSPHSTNVVSVFGDQVALLVGGDSTITPAAGVEYFDKVGAFKTESFGQANKHGIDSWAYNQRGIDFVSKDQYGYNYALLYRIFDNKTRNEFQEIVLKPAENDNYKAGSGGRLGPAHIRDAYVHVLSQKANLYLDESSWVPCIVYINGNYWGVYETREKTDEADFTDYYYHTQEDSLQFMKTWNSTWAAYGGSQAVYDWNALKNFILSNNMAVQANYNYVDNLYNVKSLADYMLLNSYVVSSDWLNRNTSWWRGINTKGLNKKWQYTLWDMDATFDHYKNYTGIPNTGSNADPCDPQTLPDPGGQGHVLILNALLKNPAFKQYYVMRYFDLLNTAFSCSRMTFILDSMINVIAPEMPKQIAKWGGSLSEWQQNVQDLRNFILARCKAAGSGYIPCNGTTGPYPIKINVDPAGAGTVDINSLNLTSFVWSGIYPGGVQTNLTAHPGKNYCFDHWEFQNHIPLPGIKDTAVFVMLMKQDSIVAHFSPGGSVTVSSTATSISCGNSVTLNASPGTGFTWSPAAGLSNPGIANPVASPSATTTYTVVSTSPCGTYTSSITLQVSTVTSASVTPSSASIPCGSSTTLHASGGSSYSWSPSAGLNNTTDANPVASPTATTTYTVVAYSPCGSDKASITVKLTGAKVSITASSPAICAGESSSLLAESGITYLWSPPASLSNPFISNPVASPQTTTTYSVIVSDKCGFQDTATITLHVTPLPIPLVSPNVTICNLEKAQLSASGGLDYLWSPPIGLSCISCPNPVATPPSTTTYTVLVSNAKNCSAKSSVTVFITGDCPDIYVPTGFSPNGDNRNDVLYVFGVMTDLHFVIYNRWGQVVFETRDQSQGWDGAQNGKLVQSGVYAYKFSATDSKGTRIVKAGNITVIR